MSSWMKCIIVWFLSTFLCLSSQAQEELPFWKRKPDLYKSIVERRRVVVSVRSEKQDKREKIRIVGAGVVNAPFDFALTQVLSFESLPEVSSYFKKVVHKKEKGLLYISMLAFGYRADVLLDYKINKNKQKWAQLDWVVKNGSLKGMIGHYKVVAIGPKKTEISMWSTMNEIKVPIPDFLLKFTLEVIAEKVAQKMRSSIENNYRTIKK